MEVWLHKNDDKLYIRDREMLHSKGRLVCIGHPSFSLIATEELSDTFEKFCDAIGLENGKSCKMELRKWPVRY